jgi:hypothetical protein
VPEIQPLHLRYQAAGQSCDSSDDLLEEEQNGRDPAQNSEQE